MDLDVLAVQEVEDVDTLSRFAHEELSDLGYRFVVLVEGNDPRLIDVGMLSRLPVGGVTSWRHAVHPGEPDQPVFSRDLLQVEILDRSRRRRLFTLFNTHLKSHYVPFGQDQVAGAAAAEELRRRQAEVMATVIAAQLRPDSRFVVAGDLTTPSTPRRSLPCRSSCTWSTVWPPRSRTARPPGRPTGAGRALDPPLQAVRSAGAVRAVRPRLAEPGDREEADESRHQPAYAAER